MSYNMTGQAGLGLPPGASSSPPNCGSISAMQQMLQDLGYYNDTVDGKFGPNTENAAVAFAQANGINVGGGISSQFCQTLMDQWDVKQSTFDPGTQPSTTPLMRFKVPVGVKLKTPAEVQQYAEQSAQQSSQQMTSAVGSGVVGWWDNLGTAEKIGVGVGGAFVGGAILYAIF